MAGGRSRSRFQIFPSTELIPVPEIVGRGRKMGSVIYDNSALIEEAAVGITSDRYANVADAVDQLVGRYKSGGVEDSKKTTFRKKLKRKLIERNS